MTEPTPLAAGVAMSLYQYNVGPRERLGALANAMGLNLLEWDRETLLHLVESKHWATEMSADMALAYLRNALDRYGDESQRRVLVNLEGIKRWKTGNI